MQSAHFAESTKRRVAMRRWLLGGALLTVMGCTNGISRVGESDVVMSIVRIANGDSGFQSDVQNLETGTRADEVEVLVRVRSKNPQQLEVLVTRDVLLERYEIRYYRSDGRNTQGVEVPFNISGELSVVVPLSRTVNATFNLEVVRLQAKQEPPLRNLICRGGVDTTDQPLCGQADTLTVFAEITLYGRQIYSGDVVTTTGRLQIDFADYADQ